MSHIHLDPGNQPSFPYYPSIDSELRSKPWKALNGSKTKEEEADLYNFPYTVSNSNPTDNTNNSDIQSPQGRNVFGYFDASDDDLLEKFPIDFARIEDFCHNPSQKLIQQTQDEAYPQEAFKSTEIESDMDIVNAFSGNDDFLQQDQEVLHPDHPVEQSQCRSSIVTTFVEPNMKPLRSSCDGNRIEEDEINIVHPFSADIKNSFDLSDLDDDSGPSVKKKVCLEIGIPRQDQEHFSLKTQTQAISQTLSQRSGKPYKAIIKTNTQRKVKASEMTEGKQQPESFSSCCLVNTFTQGDFSFMTEWSEPHNFPSVFRDEALLNGTNNRQLEWAPLGIPGNPNEQLGNLFQDNTGVTHVRSQRNEETPNSEPQSNSNPSRPSPLESTDPLEDKKTSSKRPERNYLRVFVSGILKMIEARKIGLFLDDLTLSGRLTKQDVISDLQKTKQATTSYARLKNTISVEPQNILKIAKLRLVQEFITKENYEWWVHNEFAPFNFGCNRMHHKEDEKEKQLKRETFLNKRDKLCQKFLSCFQFVP